MLYCSVVCRIKWHTVALEGNNTWGCVGEVQCRYGGVGEVGRGVWRKYIGMGETEPQKQSCFCLSKPIDLYVKIILHVKLLHMKTKAVSLLDPTHSYV